MQRLLKYESWTKELAFVSCLLLSGSILFSSFLGSFALGLLCLCGIYYIIIGKGAAGLKNQIFYSLVILFLLHIIGALYSSNKTDAWLDISIKAPILLAPFSLLAIQKLEAKRVSYILKFFIASCIIACLICLGNAFYINWESGWRLFSESRSLNFELFTYQPYTRILKLQPIYFSLYLTFACAAITWLWFRAGKKYTILNSIAFLFLALNVFTLSSRMQIMVFMFLLVLAVFYHFAIKRKIWIGLLLVAILGLGGIGVIVINPVNEARFKEMIDLESDYKTNHWGGRSLRLAKWSNAMELFLEHPIIGVGSGDDLDELIKTYEKNGLQIAIDHKYNAHNQYLQFAIKLGLVGLLAFLVLVFLILKDAWSKKNYLLITFALLFFISCLTESMMERNKGVIFFAFFIPFLNKHLPDDINKEKNT